MRAVRNFGNGITVNGVGILSGNTAVQNDFNGIDATGVVSGNTTHGGGVGINVIGGVVSGNAAQANNGLDAGILTFLGTVTGNTAINPDFPCELMFW